MKSHPGHIELSPAPDGWRILRKDGSSPEIVATLEEVAERLTPGDAVALALPSRSVLMERLQLPTTETEELEGMVRLQLEKTLPYEPDEITCGFTVVDRAETETVVLAAALHTPQLDELCRPLRARQLLPAKVTAYAAAAASVCPKDRTTLLLYREQDQIVIAVVEKGELGYAQTVGAADSQILAAELPPILLSAEMEGVPSDFSAVLLDRSCSSLQSVLGPLLGVPVEIVSVGTAPVESPIDLLPTQWIHERRRLHRTERLRTRMIKGGAGVLGLLVLAIGYLVWLQFRVNALNRELERLRPELATVQRRQERWDAVSPAFDPGRYPVEILYQVYQSLPSDEVRITQFSQQLDSFTVEGEAPSASQAIQFTDSLRENPALEEYTVEAGPPEILPNDHAQFRVFAKRG